MAEAKKIAIKVAFTYTFPILTGFLFLGTAYGIMMTGLGFAPWMPVFMAIVICAGSMEFVTASLLLSGFNPIAAILMTLMVNGRHLFYGLSLLEPYKHAGKKSAYLIYALTDEAYSLLVTVPMPKGADKNWYMFYVTFFIQAYWVIGVGLGAFAGAFIEFNTLGIEFVMTALFLVLFMSHWREGKGLSRNRRAAIIGLSASFAARMFFGAEDFMIPAMVLVLVGLLGLRPWIEKGGRQDES